MRKPLPRRGLAAALLLGACGIALGATPPPQIAISPSKLEVELGRHPTTESITVMNLGKEDVAIEVSVATWDLDETSRVRLIAPDEQSLDQWMIVSPLRFTVPGGESQTVRFSIRPKVEPRPGEHRAMIYFNQVLPPGEREAMRVRFSFGVAVYATVGEVLRVGQVHDAAIVPGSNPVVARLDVSSLGSAHVRLSGRYAIYRAGAYGAASPPPLAAGETAATTEPTVVAEGLLPSRPVLPSTRRALRLETERQLEPGAYVLDLDGELGGERIRMALPFTIGRPALIAGSEAEGAR
jgi:hypothetical protein